MRYPPLGSFRLILLFLLLSTVCSAQMGDGMGSNLPGFYKNKLHLMAVITA
jgi:hypothetical protein